MNNPFGTFDIDPFGTQFHGDGGSASMLQNSQRHLSSNGGPCTDNYDPRRVLGDNSASCNSTGHNMNTANTASTMNTSNNGNTTHQTLMPSPLAAAGTTTVVAPGNLAMASSSRHSNTFGTGTTMTYDNFDSLTMRAIHPPPQAAQGQQHPVVNQHLHQHQHVHHHHHHHLTHPSQRQYRKQQHQKLGRSSHRSVGAAGSSGSVIPSSVSYSSNIFAQPQYVSSLDQELSHHFGEQAKTKEKSSPKPEPWMDELKITVSGVSLEPMNGYEVIKRLQERTTEVLTRYLPCVQFLVQCQQDLRKGLAAAQQKRLVHHVVRDAMTPRQFYTTFIANLPKRFYQENLKVMSAENLNAAFKELQKLCANAKAAESQGCEIVKNTFLGGMKDGESWGLRKWLSKQGGALYICNDTECLLNSCQKLDRSKSTTAKLAARLRPLAKNALNKLKSEVPSSYQEQSSAHPYLPFFHRLESALRGMSNFDPEDDDVICIDDDDEVEELKAKPPAPKSVKQKSGSKASSDKPKRKASEISNTSKKGSNVNEVEDDEALTVDSDIEILDSKLPARKRTKTTSPVGGSSGLLAAVTADDSEYMKALLSTFDEDNIDHIAAFDVFDKRNSLDTAYPSEKDAYDLATGIDQLARMFESNKQNVVRPDFVAPDSFWDEGERYAKILRMFSDMLRDPDTSTYFLDPVNEEQMLQEGKPLYASVIKHPLCFRDIVNGLLEDFSPADNTLTGNNGILSNETLAKWNMYNGKDLLQAIDLVFLNFLAYDKACGGGLKSAVRSMTNKLRKTLWTNIKEILDEGDLDDNEKKKHTPTRRGDGSGFVLHKSDK
ncbi:hypothetical protein IV203_009072 [Nitzschia inconspicua]|uniref:Uncharacterized protein n=1 Tax=Nitzschia inconspicua TaxID=303405 RepID=A0A9K3PQ18_9STRA|nr:hypothetical protein IV203_009072 [Nitzschia inconspicua]